MFKLMAKLRDSALDQIGTERESVCKVQSSLVCNKIRDGIVE